jgi:WD40-like Beta Propeller Repeat
MDDLRRRFAALDDMPAPDLWADIERRADASSVASRAGRLTAVEEASWRARTAPPSLLGLHPRPVAAWLVLVILLVVALVAVLLAGSRRAETVVVPDTSPRISPPPVATAALPIPALTCAEAQRAGAVSAGSWARGPASASSGQVRAGAIATLSGGPTGDGGSGTDPEIGLLDPITGEYCKALTLPNRDWIQPSQVTWSPDGAALAFVAFGSKPSGESTSQVFVLSEDGLFRGPSEANYDRPSWSPDGAHLSALGASRAGSGRASEIAILSDQGASAQHITICDPCAAWAAGWSPDSTRVAIYVDLYTIRRMSFGPSKPAFAIVDVATGAVVSIHGGPDLQQPIASGSVRWLDDHTLLGVRADGERFSIPIDDPAQAVRLGPGPIDDRMYSPDGFMFAEVFDGRPLHINDSLFVTNIATGTRLKLLQGPYIDGSSVHWSPDSTKLAFARWEAGAQDAVRGIWIVNADGTGLRHLTTVSFVLGSWQPAWPGS